MTYNYLNIRRFFVAAAVVSGALVSMGSTGVADDAKPAEPAAQATESDPLEPINRFTSGFNRAMRGAIIDPLVDGYQYVTPQPVQTSACVASAA